MRGRKTGEKFDSDYETWLIKLLIAAKAASFRARLFCRFWMCFATAWDFRRRGTCGSTKSLAYYDRSNYFIVGHKPCESLKIILNFYLIYIYEIYI